MPDVLGIVQCPKCAGKMDAAGTNLACRGCGLTFEFYDDCFVLSGGPEWDGSFAKSYTEDYYNSPVYDYSSQRLNKIISLVRPCTGRRVLDLGCGPGEVAVSCARAGADVYGVDVSRSALHLSALRGRKSGVDLHLFQFDGLSLPFRDGSFDAVIFSDVAEHIDDRTLDRLMAEMSRLLSTGGRAVIHTAPTKNIITFSKWLKAASIGMIDLYSGLVHPEYEYLHIRYHTQSSIRKHLSANSLKGTVWGEFWYIQNRDVVRMFRLLRLDQIMADQLWCVASKDFLPGYHKTGDIKTGYLKTGNTNIKCREYLGLIDVPSEVEMDKVCEFCLNCGFYGPEQGFRWTSRKAGIFLTVPEGAGSLQIEMTSFRPDLANNPATVNLYIGERRIGQVVVRDGGRQMYSVDLPAGTAPGVSEFTLEVDGAFRPCDIGLGGDRRVLGVAIYSIKII